MSMGQFSLYTVNAVEKCHSEKNAFKVPLGSVARLIPLHGKYYIPVNFTNFFIKFGESILDTYGFQKI